MSSKQGFNLASEGTEKQKREFEDREITKRIHKIEEPETRQMVEHIKARHEDELEAKRQSQVRERELMVQDIVQGRVRPARDVDLVPPGAAGLSPAEKEQVIRNRINETFGPIHERQIAKLRTQQNKEMSATLDGIEKDEGRSMDMKATQATHEPKLSHSQTDEALEMERAQGQKQSHEDPAISEAKAKLDKMRENGRDMTRGLGRGRSR